MSVEERQEGQGEVTLARDLNLFSSTMIGVGAMIGAGIFVLTGTGAGLAGPALTLAFILNGIATIFTAMVYAELGSCFPDAGGGYLWVKEALPQPAGFMSGWMSWYAHFVAGSLYAVGFGSYLTHFVSSAFGFEFWGWDLELVGKLIGVLIVIAFAYINYRGASETGLAGNIVTLTKVTVLLLFIGFGLHATFGNPDWWKHFQPFAPNGFVGVAVAMGVTFIGFEGYEIIAQSSEEIIDPKNNIPKAVFYSLLIVVPIYVLIAFTAIGSLTGVEMPVWQYLGLKKEMAMVEAARQFMPYGAMILLFAGLTSTASALNATTYSSSRVSFAMGRDHNLPDLFGEISSTTRTPHWAVAISALFMIVGVITLPIEDIAAGTVVMFKLLFLLVNVSVINLRRNRPDLDRGYVIPWFPGVPIIGIILKLFLALFLYELSPISWYSAIAWILGGTVLYYAYSRPRELQRTETPVIQEVAEPDMRDHRILLALSRPESVPPLTAVARKMGVKHDSGIWAVHAETVPDILPVGAGKQIAAEKEPLMMDAARRFEGTDLPFHWVLRATHDVGKAIKDSVRAKDIDILVMGWPGTRVAGGLGKTLDWVLARMTCDVVVVRFPKEGDALDFSRVVVPVTDSPHASFTVDIARDLADEDSELHFIHVDFGLQENQAREMASQLGIDREDLKLIEPVREGTDTQIIVDSIIDYYNKVDATGVVVGASREGVAWRRIYGEIPLGIAEATDGSFIMTKKYPGNIKTYLQEFFGSRPTEHLDRVDEI